MRDAGATLEVLATLAAAGWEEAEVLHKIGRTRSALFSPAGETATASDEEGWAVRAGDARRSFFHTMSGAPDAGTAWPEADGAGLRLPSARPVPRFAPGSDLDAPLLGENEARALLRSVATELDREMPGARLLAARLDDGSSESRLMSSREVAAVVRHRIAWLRLEAVGPPTGSAAAAPSAVIEIADREARRFRPAALARRLADRLLILERGGAPTRDRGDMVLAPAVAAALLAALADLWIGPEATARARALLDSRGRLASPAVTLVDNGRLDGGVLAAAVDGEGQPTREVLLVEGGRYRQPLLDWRQAAADRGRSQATGCNRRASWRDLPRPGASHLYLRPDPTVGPAALLADLRRGYYLLGLDGAPRVEADASRFAAPVSGFAIDDGRPAGSLSRAWLTGSVPGLLGGVQTAARDLTFLPLRGGFFGAPTLLVRGLELRG